MYEVKYSYSKPQLEAAVKFIARHNQHFLGQTDYIRKSIIENMERIAMTPEDWLSGGMGYTLWGDREDEGINSDYNSITFQISVDPDLGNDPDSSDYIEEVIRGEPISD